MKQPLLLICGPTAGGKSELAVALGKALHGEIVSADSVLVYRGLDIGSGKISPAEMDGIPHHLIDIRTPDQPYNAAEFVRNAEAAIAGIQTRRKLSIICGGTSLYVKSLLYGMAPLPKADEATRAELEKLSSEELYAALQAEDEPIAERLHPNDRLRVIRALETCKLSGTAASELQAEHGYQALRHGGLVLVLCWPRDELYQRIEERAREMLKKGLVEETKALMEIYGGDLAALGTVGYSQAREYLNGNGSFESLPEEISKYTRRLAKQQMTFWRNDPLKRGWAVRPGEREDAVVIGGEGSSKQLRNRLKGFRVLSWNRAELMEAVAKRLEQPFEGVEAWYLHAGRVFGEG